MPEGSALELTKEFLGQDGRIWITEYYSIDGEIVAERTTPKTIENEL